MFHHSCVTRRLLEYFSGKFGKPLAAIALLKCCAVVSCKLDWPRLSVLHVAPTRALKSSTSLEVMRIFSREFWLDLQSDFTMNSLHRYKTELEKGKCLFVNDGTTLFASKSQRTKDRLVGGLSELLSDESYTYQDFGSKFTLKGNVTMILNITSQAYENYKDRLFGLTFSERFLTVHHVPTKREWEAWVRQEEAAKKIHFDGMIRVEDVVSRVEIPSTHLRIVKHLAQEYSYNSLNSPVACQDLIKGTLRAHASLNRRTEVCEDDVIFVAEVRPYLRNPFSPYEGMIVKLSAQGLGTGEICRTIRKPDTYKQQVLRVIRKAELRGILDVQSPPIWDDRYTRKEVEANG
jgi:hypothetical protein